jgi:hypothetical protein
VIDRPNDLIGSMESVVEAIRSTEHPRRLDVDHLLRLSARHVSAVEFGRDLEARETDEPGYARDVLDVDPTTLRTAVLTVVLASALTTLDLCASALWFWIRPATTEHVDLGNVREHAKRAKVAIPAPFGDWLQHTYGSHQYKPIEEFRHAHIHRTVREDATVRTNVVRLGPDGTPLGVNVTRTVGANPARPPTHERRELLRQVAEFVPERWQAFWPLFVSPAAADDDLTGPASLEHHDPEGR